MFSGQTLIAARYRRIAWWHAPAVALVAMPFEGYVLGSQSFGQVKTTMT